MCGSRASCYWRLERCIWLNLRRRYRFRAHRHLLETSTDRLSSRPMSLRINLRRHLPSRTSLGGRLVAEQEWVLAVGRLGDAEVDRSDAEAQPVVRGARDTSN